MKSTGVFRLRSFCLKKEEIRMQKIIELLQKMKLHLKEEGLQETIYIMQRYIQLQLRNHKVKNTDYWKETNGPIVNIVTKIPYYDVGGGQRSSQLTKTFQRLGYSVRFFYADYSHDEKLENVYIPACVHTRITEEAIGRLRNEINSAELFIFESPLQEFLPLLHLAKEKGCRIVYENIDNWETYLGRTFFKEEVLRVFLEQADVLVGTAEPLVEQLETYLERFGIEKKTILYLANAVDGEMFCGKTKHERPKDLVEGERTFLYYGTLWGEWFDWDLVIGLAERNPKYAINLIGNAEGLQTRIKSCPANIHFLGLKAQPELPAYLQYVDYALLPFKTGKIGDYVSPLKIFEYIAMYTKVLTTPLPDIQDYPNLYFGDTVESWEAVVAKNPAVDIEAAEQFTMQNTWESRIAALQQGW